MSVVVVAVAGFRGGVDARGEEPIGGMVEGRGEGGGGEVWRRWNAEAKAVLRSGPK